MPRRPRAVEPTATSTEKSLWHYIGLSISGALLLLVIALAAAVIVVPRAAGATPLTILTNSMEPGLPPGTLIIVKPEPIASIAPGDVVTYQIAPGDPAVITHRVISLSTSSEGETTFIMQGDNNGAPDAEPVLPEQIKGVLWYSVPYLGFVSTSVGGEARGWIIPALAVALLGYAGYMIVGGLVGGAKARRAKRAEPDA